MAPKLRTKAPKSRKLSTKVPKSPEIRTKVPKSLFPSSKPEPNRSSHPFLSVPFRAAPSTLRITVDVRRGVHVRYVITAIRELDAFVPNMADRVRLAASGADRRLSGGPQRLLVLRLVVRRAFCLPRCAAGMGCAAHASHSATTAHRGGACAAGGVRRDRISYDLCEGSPGEVSRRIRALRFAHIGTVTGLASATSAPGPGSPRPHLHRDRAHPAHICTGTGRLLAPIPCTSCGSFHPARYARANAPPQADTRANAPPQAAARACPLPTHPIGTAVGIACVRARSR